MSRALDKETAAALRSGDPKAAYRAIADILTEPPSPSDSLLEIELLGRGHSLPIPSADGGSGSGYFLRDGNAVAIHKLALVQAFFVARRILQRFRSDADSPPPPPSADDAMAATAVVLLFDPEHLTAANTRKRIILSRAAGAHAAAVTVERRLVDSLLTGHLHRHTKSPTLWSHRRWLVSLSGAVANGEGEVENGGSTVVRDIVDVVMVAAVRHPRNYYAWSHARWLVTSTQNSSGNSGNSGSISVDAVAVALLPAVRDWCFRHHDDTSGWSFLLFLLSLSTTEEAHLDETLSQVEHMAASLRWTGESVWVFLRTAATAATASRQTRGTRQADGRDPKDEHSDRILQTARTLQRSSGLDPLSQDWRVLQQAQDWLVLAATTTEP